LVIRFLLLGASGVGQRASRLEGRDLLLSFLGFLVISSLLMAA